MHTGQITALHHRQLAEHIGEACSALVPGLEVGGVGGTADDLHCTGTETRLGFKRDRKERVTRTVMVCKLVPPLLSVPESSMAGRAGGKTNVRSG
jgi:hypothetical protein